jgi:hypothetical protein
MLKKALNSPVVFTTLEITVGFAVGGPLIHAALSRLAGTVPQALAFPEAAVIAKTVLVSFGFSVALFGLMGLPGGAASRAVLAGLTRLGPRIFVRGGLPLAALEGGAVLGLSQSFRARHRDVLVSSRVFGTITTAWPRTLLAELAVNAVFYPILGLAMGYDAFAMFSPALITTASAEVGLAALSHRWGGDERRRMAVAVLRGLTFFSLNSVASIAAAGIASVLTATTIQLGVGLLMSGVVLCAVSQEAAPRVEP